MSKEKTRGHCRTTKKVPLERLICIKYDLKITADCDIKKIEDKGPVCDTDC
ncbi:hypothetical protein Halha_1269 [Halobacteroides halobius DSM 5150]|uniref:Uncharacterized protein n=1 Tax=Halobacteroides halobius (strain ATCC 35273 / DSM 5150 / MD-1) TaxID=748449 RepID=L0K9K0_HALHC|nr:hypothetical protein [Halobacteroides halobius]AGB41215.1 hypothetical protein Halha_1269 [Halobacteroides halobius DSM 5150]